MSGEISRKRKGWESSRRPNSIKTEDQQLDYVLPTTAKASNPLHSKQI